MNKENLLIKWFVKLKVLYILGLCVTGAWFGSRFSGKDMPTDYWEPLAASILLLAATFAAEYKQSGENEKTRVAKNLDKDMTVHNEEIRRMMRGIQALNVNEKRPTDVQHLVKTIAATIAKIHFAKDELPIPEDSKRLYSPDETFNCDVCRGKDLDILPTGHCTRCKFDSHAWMQVIKH